MRLFFLYALIFLISCSPSQKAIIKIDRASSITGTEFYKAVAASKWKERDSLALVEILKGNIPAFLKKFVRINTSIKDVNGKTIAAHYYVMPDYLSIGSNDDFARVPLTPITAQQIADKFHCFLPTRKIVNEIHQQSTVKLEPVPLFAFRDSSPTMWHHHLIIEGQRKGRKGLISGIKKDVVITDKLTRDNRTDRVAIFGWHQLRGQPIQPLYTGHVNWYVDYSHGIRMVYRKIWVQGKQVDYMDVLKDPGLRRLLCDEEWCDVYRY